MDYTLQSAIDRSDLEFIKEYLQNVENTTVLRKAMAHAIQKWEADIACYMLSKGAPVVLPGARKEESPLHMACQLGMAQFVSQVPDLGTCLNCICYDKCKGKWTPWQCAAYHGVYSCRHEVIRILIENGADVNEPVPIYEGNRDMYTTVLISKSHKFSCYDNEMSIDFMVKQGANVNAVDDLGRTAIQQFIPRYCNLDVKLKVLAILLRAGADPLLGTQLHLWLFTLPEETIQENGISDNYEAWRKELESMRTLQFVNRLRGSSRKAKKLRTHTDKCNNVFHTGEGKPEVAIYALLFKLCPKIRKYMNVPNSDGILPLYQYLNQGYKYREVANLFLQNRAMVNIIQHCGSDEDADFARMSVLYLICEKKDDSVSFQDIPEAMRLFTNALRRGALSKVYYTAPQLNSLVLCIQAYDWALEYTECPVSGIDVVHAVFKECHHIVMHHRSKHRRNFACLINSKLLVDDIVLFMPPKEFNCEIRFDFDANSDKLQEYMRLLYEHYQEVPSMKRLCRKVIRECICTTFGQELDPFDLNHKCTCLTHIPKVLREYLAIED